MGWYTKKDVATHRGVTERCVDNWIARGLCPRPMKLGTASQSRVRFTDRQLAELDRNLAALSNPLNTSQAEAS